MLFKPIAAICISGAPFLGRVAEACTRAVYPGPEDCILTGRSVDWELPIQQSVGLSARDAADGRGQRHEAGSQCGHAAGAFGRDLGRVRRIRAIFFSIR